MLRKSQIVTLWSNLFFLINQKRYQKFFAILVCITWLLEKLDVFAVVLFISKKNLYYKWLIEITLNDEYIWNTGCAFSWNLIVWSRCIAFWKLWFFLLYNRYLTDFLRFVLLGIFIDYYIGYNIVCMRFISTNYDFKTF